jgi:hypothetical protein
MALPFSVFTNTLKTELRARNIHDPIERVRYLRHAAASAGNSRFAAAGKWIASLALAGMVIPLASDAIVRTPRTPAPPSTTASQPVSQMPSVWPVEQTKDYDLYSNGLRIENEFAVANEPRSYRLINAVQSLPLGPKRDQPAGIVFHTTESDQAPFEADQAHNLQRIGRELLLYVRHKRAYHFLIDRFGRVHRIVAESDAANHAGHSVWGDARWLYVDLNASFLGVAFEAQMQSAPQPINQPQVHAAKVLTDMLRNKYNLPGENCVTHAQVSVNAENMHVGWHTDWGSKFPFRELGLPNNYQQPNPGLYQFGFVFDPVYLQSTSPDLWRGLDLAETRVRETAARQGFSVAAYRKLLQQRYRAVESALRDAEAVEEN